MRNRLILILLVAAIGGALRTYGLQSKSLWYDEAVSAASLRFSYAEVILRKSSDASVHPPFYFLAMKAWGDTFGDSEVALRSLAVVCGILTILGMYLLGRGLCEVGDASPSDATRVGLISALLTAVAPLQIVSSQQVRGYSLGTALLAWSSWALLRALFGPNAYRRTFWGLWAVLSVLLCYTSNLAVLSVGAQVLFVVVVLGSAALRARRSELNSSGMADGDSSPAGFLGGVGPHLGRTQFRSAAAAVCFVFIAYGIPWGSQLLAQSETVRTTTAIVKPLTLERSLREIHRAAVASWGSPPSDESLTHVAVATLLICMFGWLAFRGGRTGIFLLLTGLIPVLVIVGFSAISNRSIVQARYLTFAQLMWLAAAAFALFRGESRLEQTVIAAWLIGIGGYLCFPAWGEMTQDAQPGMRGAVQYALQNREEHEMLLAAERHVFFGMSYYMRQHDAPPALLTDHTTTLSVRGGYEMQDSDLITPEELLSRDLRGIWVFTTDAYGAHQRADFTPPKCWERVDVESFTQDYFWERPVTVSHYRIRDCGPKCCGKTSRRQPSESAIGFIRQPRGA